MKTDALEQKSVESFEICKEIEISAPIDITFEAMLDTIGPEGQMPGSKPFPIRQWSIPQLIKELGRDACTRIDRVINARRDQSVRWINL